MLNPGEIGGSPLEVTNIGGQSEMMLALADMSNTVNDLWAINQLSWIPILICIQERGIYDIG